MVMAYFHVLAGAHENALPPVVRKLEWTDLKYALAKGVEDFSAMPSHLAFLGLIYPILGISLAALTFSNNALPLLYPLASGFALVGPFAAIGLYEISRRRELGESVSWKNAFDVMRSPAIPSILTLGMLLMVVFLVWLSAARVLYEALFGSVPPESYLNFLHDVLTTERGWILMLVGNAVGFVFAVVALVISVVSFPLMLDRDVGVPTAVQTSVQAVAANPGMMALWGLIVSAALLLGSVPLFVGLAVVMPVLGHATWHLYRRIVEPAAADDNAP
jgi:uncharacterized membrane protein